MPRTSVEDFIYVHASSSSNIWDAAKRGKTDVIAILPRPALFNEEASSVNITPNMGEYAIYDILTSVNNLRITLTDSYGNTLPPFKNEYTLRLSVKFV